MFKLAVYDHSEMESDDLNSADACEVIRAETSGEAWAEFYARYGTNDYSAAQATECYLEVRFNG